MTTLADVTAAGIPVKIAGIDTILEPLNLADLGILMNKITEERKAAGETLLRMAAEAIPLFPPEMQTVRWQEALREARRPVSVTLEETLTYLESIEGISLALFIKLDVRHPGVFNQGQIQKFIIAEAEADRLDTLIEKFAAFSGLTEEPSEDAAGNRKPAKSRQKGR